MGSAMFLLSALFIRFQRLNHFRHIGPRGVFLLVIWREPVAPLTVLRCVVPGCVACGGIEMFAVDEFVIDVFVAIPSTMPAFAAADSTSGVSV